MFTWRKSVESRLQRLDERFDKIDQVLVKQSEILDRNTATLEDHVKRTNILQDFVTMLPITLLKWSVGFVGGCGVIIGFIYGLIQLYEKLAP